MCNVIVFFLLTFFEWKLKMAHGGSWKTKRRRGDFTNSLMSFQKCSDNGVFWCACTFWLGHVLRAALFSNSTSKSGPSMGCFWHFDFEMCFAPQGQVLMSHLPGWLRTRRFTVASLLFPFRAPWSSFYTDLLATDSFSSGSFSSLPLTTSAVSSVHTVGSLTSKLLSTIYTTYPLVHWYLPAKTQKTMELSWFPVRKWATSMVHFPYLQCKFSWCHGAWRRCRTSGSWHPDSWRSGSAWRRKVQQTGQQLNDVKGKCWSNSHLLSGCCDLMISVPRSKIIRNIIFKEYISDTSVSSPY